MNDGLKHALCALSFYRARHQQRKRFTRSSKPHNQVKTVGQRARMVYLARKEIALARDAGWRGSVKQALGLSA